MTDDLRDRLATLRGSSSLHAPDFPASTSGIRSFERLQSALRLEALLELS